VVPAALLAISAFAQTAPPKTFLKVGDTAPDFSFSAGAASNRTAVKLSDFRGKKNVIIAFFPAAFTGG
jgi:peroxiredoxin